MLLRVYNTLTRRLEVFNPRYGKKVQMFVCGQTVQDDAHMGHAKTYTQFDIIVRWLKYTGYDVFYVQNITDVDDKIVNRAQEKNIEPLIFSKRQTTRFLKDMEALGIKENITMFPKTSNYIPQMIEQIKTLIKKGYAYVVDGDVYYDVARFKDYTRLSRMPIEQLKKHRIEPDPRKRNPFDFALWKSRKPSELSWDSPWGRGRPGWHIEDTAMTWTIFGPQYDLHGGASELIFPHHTNEIAQAEAASGKKPFVKYWLHTGTLKTHGVEMHKSLGNAVPIRKMLAKYDVEVLRLYFASTHYRKPIEFDEKNLKESKNELDYLYNGLSNVQNAASDKGNGHTELKRALREVKRKFAEAMNDDFNTPLALTHLYALAREANRSTTKLRIDSKLAANTIGTIRELGRIFGILQKTEEGIPPEIEELARLHENSRKRKDWKRADAIRKQIKELGFVVEDASQGPRLRKIKNQDSYST